MKLTQSQIPEIVNEIDILSLFSNRGAVAVVEQQWCCIWL